jgi:glutamyl-tRNA reductase
MRVLMIGVNHKTASVEMRERLAFSGSLADELLEQFRASYPSAEAVLLSTCNRTEIYVARASHEAPSAEDVAQFLARRSGLTLEQVSGVLIQWEGDDAVEHLLKVACGLDSMVLGEPQILGQVKRAYEQSNRNQAVGPVLHKTFQHAIAGAKTIRTQTGIDAGRLSVGSVAVDFARQIFETFGDKNVLAIGAGDMAKVTLRHLLELEPRRLVVANRTVAKAQALVEMLGINDGRGRAAPLDDLAGLLVEADIVVSSTGAAQPIITHGLLKPVMKSRRSRPLFLIDIAVPRDVASDVQSLENVYSYNLDDLQRVVNETLGSRTELVRACESLIKESARKCLTQLQHRDVGQVIRALKTKLHAVGEAEMLRTGRKLASPGASPEEIARILEEHNHRLINKILHIPLSKLDTSDHQAPIGYYAAALKKLFELDAPTGPASGLGEETQKAKPESGLSLEGQTNPAGAGEKGRA